MSFDQSAELGELAAALCRVQATGLRALKNKRNQHLRSEYADLEACWEACRDALRDNHISVAQFPGPLRLEDGRYIIKLRTVLMHASGQWLAGVSEVPVAEVMKGLSDPQIFGVVTSYARRYALCAAVGISISEDDDDGESAPRSEERAPRAAGPPPARWQDFANQRWMQVPVPDGHGVLGELSESERANCIRMYAKKHPAVAGMMADVIEAQMNDALVTYEDLRGKLGMELPPKFEQMDLPTLCAFVGAFRKYQDTIR